MFNHKLPSLALADGFIPIQLLTLKEANKKLNMSHRRPRWNYDETWEVDTANLDWKRKLETLWQYLLFRHAMWGTKQGVYEVMKDSMEKKNNTLVDSISDKRQPR